MHCLSISSMGKNLAVEWINYQSNFNRIVSVVCVGGMIDEIKSPCGPFGDCRVQRVSVEVTVGEREGAELSLP